MRRTISRTLGWVLIVLIPVAVALILQRGAGAYLYASVWDGNEAALKVFTGPADARYASAVAAMSAEAKRQGFRFPEPRVIQTNFLYRLISRWESRPKYMAVDPSGSLIVVDHTKMAAFTESDLECAMAHELGHVIDYTTKREGHPVFERIGCLGDQEFADSVGRMLCGAARYDALVRRVIRHRPLVITRRCD